MPEHDMTKRAFEIHGLTKKKLEEKGAKKWTKGASEELSRFLSEYAELPIVAHCAEYDYEKVLVKAFKDVGSLDWLPPAERWRCTQNLAKNKLVLAHYGLDEVLEGCGLDAREPDEPHEAEKDAECAADVYMHLKTLPDLEKTELGFWEQ